MRSIIFTLMPGSNGQTSYLIRSLIETVNTSSCRAAVGRQLTRNNVRVAGRNWTKGTREYMNFDIVYVFYEKEIGTDGEKRILDIHRCREAYMPSSHIFFLSMLAAHKCFPIQ